MTELSNDFAAIGTAGGIGLQLAVPQQSSDIISLHTIMGTADDKVKKKIYGARITPNRRK